jgi:membrane protein required for colicin V production
VLLLVCAGLTPLPMDPWWRQSALIPRLLPAARWAIEWLPADYRDEFDYESTGAGAPSADGTGAPPS